MVPSYPGSTPDNCAPLKNLIDNSQLVIPIATVGVLIFLLSIKGNSLLINFSLTSPSLLFIHIAFRIICLQRSLSIATYLQSLLIAPSAVQIL